MSDPRLLEHTISWEAEEGLEAEVLDLTPQPPLPTDTAPAQETLAHSASSDIDLKADLGDFVESAAKSTRRRNFKDGFYSEKDLPKRLVPDETDIKTHHSTGNFPHAHVPLGEAQFNHRSHHRHGRHRHHRHHHGHKHGHRKEKLDEKKNEEHTVSPDYVALNIDQTVSGDRQTEVPQLVFLPDATTTSSDDIPRHSSIDSVPSDVSIGKHMRDMLHGSGTTISRNSAEDMSLHSELSSQASLPSKSSNSSMGSDQSKTAYRERRSSVKPMDYIKEDEPVHFTLGDEDEDEKNEEVPVVEMKETSTADKKSHHKRHQKDRQKEVGMVRKGSEIKLQDEEAIKNLNKSAKKKETFVVEVDEEEEQETEDIARHRFEDHTRTHHRRKHSHKRKVRGPVMASVIHVGKEGKEKKRKKKIVSLTTKKKPPVDHSPHEMFVELDELHFGEDQQWKWQERARWIKFEENVAEGGDKWGKPHVASLSFHSLLELRHCLANGAVLLDLEDDDLYSMVDTMVAELVQVGQLEEDDKEAVIQALLLKHRHMDKEPSFLRRNLTQLRLRSSFHGSKASSKKLVKDDSEITKENVPLDTENDNMVEETDIPEVKVIPKSSSFPANLSNGSALPRDADEQINVAVGDPDLHKRSMSVQREGIHRSYSRASIRSTRSGITDEPQGQSIMKRIPEGAEATNVLVGSLDFLDSPIMAFVRLSEGRYFGNMMEVPLPVRFVFVLLGPDTGNLDYHEIGRSISTLMANHHFHDLAYRAESRQDLIDAINEFLDDSIVLPPGEWDKKTLLPIMDMAKKRAQAKKRQREKELAKAEKEAFRDPLQRTGKLFGGMINDIKTRYPWYWSDIKDGINFQCLAAFFFIYFACLSPAITFGGLLSEKVKGWLGVSEMLVGTCICGVLMALLAGQPVLILGATGPKLVFEAALYQICESMGIEFISFRFWVGFWVAVTTIIVIAVEGCFLVRYFTRFIEDIFSLLISLIFVIETFVKLSKIFKKNPLLEYYPLPHDYTNQSISLGDTITHSLELLSTLSPLSHSTLDSNFSVTALMQRAVTGLDNNTKSPEYGYVKDPQPNVALMSLVLCFGTFLIASFLKDFRNSKFLGRTARRAIGDFGIPIAILAMVLVDVFTPEVDTEKLYVPSGLAPTAGDRRGWVINPTGSPGHKLPVWAYFFAIVPALLLFILMFMESEITCMIANKKERNLKKGTGYHLDMMLIGCFGIICGILGLPFLCAASVRTIAHISSLSVFSRTHAPGDKPQLIEVKEQRMTALAVHIVIGLSVLLGPILNRVPLAVLFGVFLYMGIASMNGVQMLDRFKLIFMPVKHHPDVGYVKKVRTYKMHLFTFIQLVALGILWAVKSTAAALAFPFVLILLVPVRLKLLPFIFTDKELLELDKGEEDESEDEEEPDFYEQTHIPI